MIWLLRSAIAALLAAFLGLWAVAPSDAAAPHSLTPPIFAYDGQHHAAVPTHTTPERGPPETYDHSSTAYDDSDGLLSLGASARPNVAAIRAAYGYEHLVSFVQIASRSRGTEEQVSSAVPGSVAVERSDIAANSAVPAIKAGSEGGESAGRAFSQRVRQEALDENPSTCVYCRMETDRPQVDYVIARSRGGNATLDNAQTTCWWCNASKGARDFPVNPPPGFEGVWPSWWFLP